MSFALTQEQVLAKTKTVTRRFGWWFLKPGTLLQPVAKAMGLKKGEAIQRLGGPIRVVSTREEMLANITAEDCVLEGFPGMQPHEFVAMLDRHYSGGKQTGLSYATVNRILFEYA
jgi:hypothetical protein